MSRKRHVTKAEMRDLTAKIAKLAERMELAINQIEDDGIEIDGWDAALRGASGLRSQFVKVIGEANLRDVLFSEYKPIANKLGGMAAESKPSYVPPTGSKPRKKPES
jgi:hypothetical protein